ncbi:peptide chain release factor N(5)-glutamine methyltransferase [Candidatus Pelagibacter sp.]|nr:peptide chain release factor N(5)-glutamine methyltransferase [Candidatus Pelagibacter sp.]
MNIQSAIMYGTKILKDKNITTAHLDSEILMMKVIGKDRKYIILNNDQNLKSEKLNEFEKLIKERSKGKPIAYLTNLKHFWKYKFKVTDDTLIPRPDSEIIIEEVLKITKNKNKISVLDIGIGSGCLLISILKERKNFCGIGIDINKNCLKISKINANKLNVANRIKFYKSDVDKFVLGKYDLIVSNPPYINTHEIKYLEKDVAKFEPAIALNGGLDGLSEIRKVVKKSSELIKRNGKFILEIGTKQKNKTIKLLKEKGFYINGVLKDLSKNDRCIVSTKI